MSQNILIPDNEQNNEHNHHMNLSNVIDIANLNIINIDDNNIIIEKKPILPCKKTVKKKDSKNEHVEITYENYTKNILALSSYKIPELKEVAKELGLRFSGTKQVLIDRIENQFKSTKYAIRIQRIYRGRIVRQSFKLRGPALKERTKCINDTDFITMEPLSEIESEYFYSYADSKQFIYGFNIISLIQMNEKQNNKVINPYNREKLDATVMSNIIRLFNLTKIIYSNFKTENARYNSRYTSNNRYTGVRTRNTTYQYNTTNQQNIIQAAPVTEYTQRLNALLEMRTQPLSQRIQNVFIKLDQLGNYTQSNWFTDLNFRQVLLLYRELYEIWYYRGHLPRELKIKICPYFDIFYNILPRTVPPPELSLEQIKVASISVFENIINAGIDEDHQKIGAFHALSALTLVSNDARNALPWLYESVAY
jgi:hypothetical protein